MLHRPAFCFWYFLLFLLAAVALPAQVISVTPAQPGADDFVTITFDATAGNAALKDHPGPVYAHTGVILGTPENPSGWRYVQGNWGTDDERMKMEKIGPNRYRIRFLIRTFYGVPEDENFLQMAFVFRNQNGSIVAKGEGEADIYYPEIQTFPHGPIELADGSDGQFMGDLQGLSVQEDGSLLLSDGQRQLLVRSYGPGLINLVFFPHQQKRLQVPASEAIVLPVQAPPLPDNLYGAGPLDLPWGEGYTLRIKRNPIRLSVLKDGQVIVADAQGAFFDEQEARIGPVSGLRLQLQPGERLFGLGSRAVEMDRRGRRLYGYNAPSYGYTWGAEDVYISIPYVLSSRGYGLLFDSYRKTYFDLGATDAAVMEFGAKDTFFSAVYVLGEDPATLTRRYTELTGRQALPPRWALGYIQSRYGYKSQAEAERIVQQTLAAGFPLDAVLFDLYWFGGKERMGDLAWARDSFPEPERMLARLNDKGVHPILITETYFVEGTNHFDELDRRGLLAKGPEGESYVIPDFWAGPAALLDVFQPQVGSWFWPFYQKQMEKGAAGFWSDSGEPENHPSKMRHSRGTAEEVHNLYAQYWAAQLAGHHDRLNPDRRFFNLMRSGYAGMQRYYTFPWSGDVTRSWDAYRAQVPIMLGIGLCGVGYMHSDLGGFTGGPKDEELYQRWLQFGAFTPLMRVHGDAEGIAPEPIFYEPRTQAIVKEAIRQRYRLLPYTYTLAWENATQGLPLARPMFLHFSEDTATYRLNEQYLWGKDLLVAPVLEKGARRKSVYFPAGVWYNFHSGEREAVSGWANVALTPERIPVYVRAGAFVPQAGDLVNTRAFQGDKLAVHHYLDPEKQPQQGHWYLDDGKQATAIGTEAYQLTRIATAWKKKKWTLLWQAEGQGFAGQPANQTLTWVVHGLAEAPKKLQFQGKKLDLVDLNPGDTPPPMTAWYDAGTQTLRFTVSWAGEPAEVALRVR